MQILGGLSMREKINIILIVFLLFFAYINNAYSDNLSNLLGEYAQEGDLSQQTKKEASGNLIVFTRADLDRMKVKSLVELIGYIPFIRYNEDETNLSDITYAPYQYGAFNPLIIYLNGKEIISPFFGNGFQIVSKIDMNFIDHVDIYLNVPSYNIGIHSSLYVIKLYTKKGYRENSTVAGSCLGSHNTNNQYIYSGRGDEDSSFFVYLNRKFLNRKKLHHTEDEKVYDLSRNSRYYNLFGEIDKKNIKIDVEALWVDLDNFIGRSWNMTTKYANSKFNYLTGDFEYISDDKSFKSELSYSTYLTKGRQNSDGPLGFFSVSPGSIATYNNFDLKLREQLADVNIEKIFKIKNYELLLGVFGRYKHFDFEDYKTHIPSMGTINFPIPHYNREYVYDIYIENQYTYNNSNIFMFSLKTEKHFLNGNIRNYSLFGAKAGYIYNDNSKTFKAFIYSKQEPLSSYLLFMQNAQNKERVSVSASKGLSAEFDYKRNSSVYSALFIRSYRKNYIYFTDRYRNFDKNFTLTGISLGYQYSFDAFNKIRLNGWYVNAKNILSLENYQVGSKSANFFGGSVSLFNRLGKFDLFNSLLYKSVYNDNRPALNLCSTITYSPTRRLSIYLKGVNLLHKGVTTDYLTVNPLTGKSTTLQDVQPIDRSIWVGMEYAF
jgi:vitamin B12 transporter